MNKASGSGLRASGCNRSDGGPHPERRRNMLVSGAGASQAPSSLQSHPRLPERAARTCDDILLAGSVFSSIHCPLRRTSPQLRAARHSDPGDRTAKHLAYVACSGRVGVGAYYNDLGATFQGSAAGRDDVRRSGSGYSRNTLPRSRAVGTIRWHTSHGDARALKANEPCTGVKGNRGDGLRSGQWILENTLPANRPSLRSPFMLAHQARYASNTC